MRWGDFKMGLNCDTLVPLAYSTRLTSDVCRIIYKRMIRQRALAFPVKGGTHMTSRGKVAFFGSSALSLMAMAVFCMFGGHSSVYAATNCSFNGQLFSPGACITDSCGSLNNVPQVMVCHCDGTWSGCGSTSMCGVTHCGH